MRVYHEEYGFVTMIQRWEAMGVAVILFEHGQRIVPLEELEVVE